MGLAAAASEEGGGWSRLETERALKDGKALGECFSKWVLQNTRAAGRMRRRKAVLDSIRQGNVL